MSDGFVFVNRTIYKDSLVGHKGHFPVFVLVGSEFQWVKLHAVRVFAEVVDGAVCLAVRGCVLCHRCGSRVPPRLRYCEWVICVCLGQDLVAVTIFSSLLTLIGWE